MNKDCTKCMYGAPQTNDPLIDMKRILCKRYPEHRTLNLPHWCGEHKPQRKPRK